MMLLTKDCKEKKANDYEATSETWSAQNTESKHQSLCLTYDFLAAENPEHGLPDLGYF